MLGALLKKLRKPLPSTDGGELATQGSQQGRGTALLRVTRSVSSAGKQELAIFSLLTFADVYHVIGREEK